LHFALYASAEKCFLNKGIVNWMAYLAFQEVYPELFELIHMEWSLIKEIDCVYKQKYKLSDIAKIINKLSNHEVDIIVENSELGLSYCGYNYNSDIDFDGLELGIKKVYESLL
jgi:hypothetical protein